MTAMVFLNGQTGLRPDSVGRLPEQVAGAFTRRGGEARDVLRRR